MMNIIILKMCFNRHAVKKYIAYDISLMAGACLAAIALTYFLTQSLGMSAAAASVMAPPMGIGGYDFVIY